MGLNKVKIFNSHYFLSKAAGEEIIKRIKKKPNLTISFPSGDTPVEMYRFLVKKAKKEKGSFLRIKVFQLDEYLGLAKYNTFSFYYFLNKHLFMHLDIKKENIFSFNGLTRNPEVECLFYEEELKNTKGLDLIILGIGINGHIAFNEPGSSPKSRTRIINLDQSTIKANSRFFKNIKKVPEKALTMGLADILKAKEIFLLANGVHKAKAVAKALCGPITKDLPASYLQKHPNTTFFLDPKAASLI